MNKKDCLKELGKIRIKIIDEIITGEIDSEDLYKAKYALLTSYRTKVVVSMIANGFYDFEIDEFERIGDKMPMNVSCPEAQIKSMAKIICRGIQGLRSQYKKLD
jgi:hypothetical protein